MFLVGFFVFKFIIGYKFKGISKFFKGDSLASIDFQHFCEHSDKLRRKVLMLHNLTECFCSFTISIILTCLEDILTIDFALVGI